MGWAGRNKILSSTDLEPCSGPVPGHSVAAGGWFLLWDTPAWVLGLAPLRGGGAKGGPAEVGLTKGGDSHDYKTIERRCCAVGIVFYLKFQLFLLIYRKTTDFES